MEGTENQAKESVINFIGYALLMKINKSYLRKISLVVVVGLMVSSSSKGYIHPELQGITISYLE